MDNFLTTFLAIFTLRLTFQTTLWSSVSLLLCGGVLGITNAQDSDILKQLKPIGSNATVVCPGCNNGSPCHVIVNDMDKDDYVLLDNGSLVLPANDPSIYGNISCGGPEESMEYLICPPNDRQYDWLHIEPNINITVTVGDMFVISATFLQMPHSGTSLRIDETGISSDADISCSSTNVQGKVVNYTCTANRPSTKVIKAQLTFCDIEFCSLPLTITIKEKSGTMTSGETSSSMIMPSHVMTSYGISTTPASSSSFSTSLTLNVTVAASSSMVEKSSSVIMGTDIPINNDDDDVSGGVIAIIIISAVIVPLAVVAIAIIVTRIYLKRFRSNNAPSTIPSVRNGNLVNPHDDFPNPNATDNGNLPTADKLVTETNGVSAGNHILSGNNGYLPQEKDDIHTAVAEEEEETEFIPNIQGNAKLEHSVVPKEETRFPQHSGNSELAVPPFSGMKTQKDSSP